MTMHKLQSYSLSVSKKKGSMRLCSAKECKVVTDFLQFDEIIVQFQDYFDATCPLLFMN